MAGKHEPRSNATFYLSLATATLRAGLVIAAVALGVFVLTKAFPTGSQAETSREPSQDIGDTSPSPGTTTSPDSTDEPQPNAVDLTGVRIQVLNATDESGLAAAVADDLRQDYGVRIDQVGNASGTYEVTTLFFRPDSRAIAVELRRLRFRGAQLEAATNDLNRDVQVTIVLASDFAESN